MRNFGTCLACTLVMALPVFAADTADLHKLRSKIAKEPAYSSRQPLYGLLVIGSEHGARVWMVLDQSNPKTNRYDVLYADVNGNGDLSEAAERFIGTEEGTDTRFHLPAFKDPASGATHEGFTVRVSGDTTPTVMVSLKWRGGSKMGGGYPEESEHGYLKFASKPTAAPILWANGDGPFRFQRWYSGKLTIGAADDLKVFVGQQGVGASSFWAFQEHVLPESEGVQATLIYRDKQGTEHREVSRLHDRC